MKPRTLAFLALAAMLALIAAIWLGTARAPDTRTDAAGLLAPGLSEALDQVDQVRIVAAGETPLATLRKQAEGWGLDERSGYRVDVEKLRGLLAAIAGARRVEAKTAQPARYAQLGVEDVSAADAHGARVDIHAGDRQWSIIFGDNVARGTGTYVRLAGEAQSWLIGNNIAIERTPANWLVKRLLDVGANRVVGIEVTPEQGPAIRLARAEQPQIDSDFVFIGLPKGREPGPGYGREALAGFLSGLNFEDVFPAMDRPEPSSLRRASYRLDDGRVVLIHAWTQEGKTLARFSETLDEDRATAWIARQTTAQALAEGADGASGQAGDAVLPTLETLRADVAAFEHDHAPWVYVLPGFKASNLEKGLEDYLKPRP